MLAVLAHWTLEPCTCSGSKPSKLVLATSSLQRFYPTACSNMIGLKIFSSTLYNFCQSTSAIIHQCVAGVSH